MPTLDEIRSAGEVDLQMLLADLDARHRRKIKAAIKDYGNVRDIPESFWEDLQREIEEETAAALLLLMLAADDWTASSLERQDPRLSRTAPSLSGYATSAARNAVEVASQTTSTVRDRLQRKITDQQVSPAGGIGTLTDEGIEGALDDVFTPERRETIAIDQTTQALSAGQRGAAGRIGGDGATTADGQRVEVVLYWVTEKDNRVCPRCAPLDGKPEEVWSRVFPNGPGPEAHPRCRCELRSVVIVTSEAAA